MQIGLEFDLDKEAQTKKKTHFFLNGSWRQLGAVRPSDEWLLRVQFPAQIDEREQTRRSIVKALCPAKQTAIRTICSAAQSEGSEEKKKKVIAFHQADLQANDGFRPVVVCIYPSRRRGSHQAAAFQRGCGGEEEEEEERGEAL